MATITPQENVVNPTGVRASYLAASYVGMKNGDVGASPDGDTATCAASSVQVTGAFGGASVGVEGTNDGENWSPLHDSSGITVSIRQSGIVAVLESSVQIRPTVTGGDATTDLTVTMMFRRA